MSRLRCAFLILLPACKFPELPAIDESDSANIDDAGGSDALDGAPCEGDRYGYAISNIAPCDVPVASAALDLTNVASIDTFAGTMTSIGGSTAPLPSSRLVAQANGPMIRVVSVTALDVQATATVNIVGENAVAFLVRGNASVAGTLTLTGGALQANGPAGRRTACGTGSGGPGLGSGNGGGGGGGGLGSTGGPGGYGNSDPATAGVAGVALVTPGRSPLWGGCAGSPGSGGTLPGGGGGAIQLSVSGTLDLGGTIATGGGGGNGGLNAGGGGGGSGGMILLEAGVGLMGSGSLTANGGAGGGGGSGATPAGSGLAGCLRCANAAFGGGATAGSGSGGNGAAGSSGATSGVSTSLSGGGGGGGVGLIWLRAPSINLPGLISPNPRTSSL